MAISFSRPDPSSPAAVGSAAFPINRRGFDQGEVRDFLRMVAAELARLQERERFLESELRAMQTRGMSAPGRLDEETVISLLGEEAARVLATARDASTQIRDRAEESATRLVKDAADDASRLRESAMNEAARIHEDAVADAEAEIELAKQQGRDMVNEAREYREKVLSELSRRRDAARAQIEQLLHGRDRLLSAFERARLATDAVLGELTDAHDEPEFIVDLAPTTGPVPVVNPAHPSVSPVVTVFDHQAEDRPRRSTERVEAPTVVTVEPPSERDEHPVVVVDVEPDIADVVEEQPVVVEPNDTIESDLDDVPAAEVVEAPPVVEVGTEIEIDVEAEAAPVAPIETEALEAESDGQASNVVSLFGRNRRPVQVPEIEDVAAVEPANDPAPAPEVVEPDHPVRVAPAERALDDIFSRLRAGSTSDVADRTSIVTDGKPIVADKKTNAAERASAPQKNKKPPVAVPEPARFDERSQLISPIVASASRRLKRLLMDEQNGVLEHLRTKRSSLDIDAIFGDADEQAGRYVESATEDLLEAAGAGVKAVKPHGGSARRVAEESVVSDIRSMVLDGLVAAFREDARIALGEAEGDRDVAAGLMRDIYRAWKSDRMDSFVEDIVCRAFGAGAYSALEPGTWVMWMHSPDGCCSECEDNSLAGAVRAGESFPTGQTNAPAHSGCRCLVWPIRN